MIDGLQRGDHLGRRAVPRRRVLGHGAEHDCAAVVGDVGPDRPGVGRGLVDMAEEHRRGVLAAVGVGPGEQGEVRRPQAVEIGAGVHAGVLHLLGGHVCRRAHHLAGLGDGVAGLLGPRQAEVGQLHRAAVAEHHVGRLDVAVHHPRSVDGPQPAGGADQDAGRLRGRKAVGVLLEQVAGRAPTDQFHGDEVGVAVAADLVHADHVGVPHPGGRPAFAQEPLDVFGPLVGQFRRQQLERDLGPRAAVGRRVHRPHAALAEHAGDLVVAHGAARPAQPSAAGVADGLQVLGHLGGVAVAVGGVLGAGLLQHRPEALGQRHARRAGVGERGGQVTGEHLHQRPALHRVITDQQEPERQAQGVDVAGRRGGFAGALFGRHVLRTAQERPGGGELRGVRRRAGQPEVGDLHAAVGCQQQVAGLDVAVDDALGVGGRQGPGAAGDDAGGLAGRHRAVGPDLGVQGPAGHVLGDDERAAAELADLEHRDDVGMAQGGGQAGLAEEPLAGLGVGGGEELDGDLPAEDGVLGAVDHPHPAAAQQPPDCVAADFGAGRKLRNRRGRCVVLGRHPAVPFRAREWVSRP